MHHSFGKGWIRKSASVRAKSKPRTVWGRPLNATEGGSGGELNIRVPGRRRRTAGQSPTCTWISSRRHVQCRSLGRKRQGEVVSASTVP